jgi:hypothetical protein
MAVVQGSGIVLSDERLSIAVNIPRTRQVIG